MFISSSARSPILLGVSRVNYNFCIENLHLQGNIESSLDSAQYVMHILLAYFHFLFVLCRTFFCTIIADPKNFSDVLIARVSDILSFCMKLVSVVRIRLFLLEINAWVTMNAESQVNFFDLLSFKNQVFVFELILQSRFPPLVLAARN